MGALGGVTDATIAAMERLGADRARIAAAIGPCIARASYEVDAAFVARFEEADPANERFFAAGRARHAQFALEAYRSEEPPSELPSLITNSYAVLFLKKKT